MLMYLNFEQNKSFFIFNDTQFIRALILHALTDFDEFQIYS